MISRGMRVEYASCPMFFFRSVYFVFLPVFSYTSIAALDINYYLEL